MINAAAAHLALRARLLAVSGIPAARAFDNKKYVGVPGTPYIADSWVPATNTLRTITARNGTGQETGLYVVQWFGLADAGITDIRAGVQGILAAFTPGTAVTSTTGDVIVETFKRRKMP